MTALTISSKRVAGASLGVQVMRYVFDLPSRGHRFILVQSEADEDTGSESDYEAGSFGEGSSSDDDEESEFDGSDASDDEGSGSDFDDESEGEDWDALERKAIRGQFFFRTVNLSINLAAR